MQIYTVSFFGHRRIADWQTAENRLLREISDLIKTKEYVEFLVGRNGDFDQMAASAVRSAKRELDYGNSELVYIGMKMNSMTDKKIMEKFVEASKAGVKIELVIRGICCLRPNVPEKTENIRIISIVGRYLEHSRIYMFGTGKEQKMYIASADLMTRNTLKRVEVAVPIYDEDIKTQISYMFSTMLSDNVQAREMQSDGTYIKVKNHRKRINSQELFGKLAYEKSEQRKLTLE